MREHASGAISALLVAGLVAGSLVALLARAGVGDPLTWLDDPHVWRAVRFTLLQAALSALMSLSLGLMTARSLAMLGPFAGRGLVLAVLSVPIVLPSLIAVFGIVAIYGNNGILARVLRAAGLGAEWNLYGLGGILAAHVFFNLPLATRLLLPAWNSIPVETWRLADQLGMRGLAAFRLIEWPVLRRYLPHAAAILFMICATSFAIVLALGGGPRSATLEVVIFEALRFDANPPRAAHIALLGMALTLPMLLAAQYFSKSLPLGSTLEQGRWLVRSRRRRSRMADRGWIGLALLIVLPPLLAAVGDGLVGAAKGGMEAGALGRALVISLAIALPAGFAAAVLALLIGSAEAGARRSGHPLAGWLGVAGVLPLALSPMALALGLYLLLGSWIDGRALTLCGIILMNGLIAVPFLAAILRPVLERNLERHQRLCRALGIRGRARWSLIDWPNLRGSLGQAAALGVAFSLGDLVAVGLYGDPSIRTLSLLLYDQLSAYRMQNAAATSLVLMIVVFAAYRLIERGIGGRHAP